MRVSAHTVSTVRKAIVRQMLVASALNPSTREGEVGGALDCIASLVCRASLRTVIAIQRNPVLTPPPPKKRKARNKHYRTIVKKSF